MRFFRWLGRLEDVILVKSLKLGIIGGFKICSCFLGVLVMEGFS